MASEAASRLKKNWMEMPDECFETLTFGELKVDQKFISLPEPGDNSGHGGLKGAHYIFIKTRQRVTETESGLPYSTSHGKAANIQRGISNDFPDSMFVILIK
jgi:hypothetical protein